MPADRRRAAAEKDFGRSPQFISGQADGRPGIHALIIGAQSVMLTSGVIVVTPVPFCLKMLSTDIGPSTRHEFHPAVGNQALLRLLRPGVIQPKLTVKPPDDVYEQEADRHF